MATHSNILAWKIPWTEEPCRLQSGDEGPHLSMTGESRGCSRAAAPVCGFSRGTTARSVRRRLLRVHWTARKSNQSILKEMSPEYSLERLMLKLKLQYFGHLM